MTMEGYLSIKEAAKRVGLTPKTIRYYEQVGVIPTVKRNRSGARGNSYRLFSERDINRLGFVKRARRLGLSLVQVKELLTATERGVASRRLLAFINQKVSEVDENIRDLESLRQTLVELRHRLEDAEEPPGSCCEPVCGPLTCGPENESVPLVRITDVSQ